MEDKKYKDITGAIFMVSLGILFLLNTTNAVPWSIWLHILRFWPIILILAGIKIILPDNRIGQIVYPIIYTLFIILIGASSYFFVMNKPIPFVPEGITHCFFNECRAAQDESLTQDDVYVHATDYTEVTSRNLDITIAASKLILGDEKNDYFLHSQSEFFNKNDKPTLETELRDSVLTTTFDNTTVRHYGLWNFKTPEYTLTLGQETIPTTVSIELGAGEGIVDFDSTNLKEINTTVGAGSLDITLGLASIPETISMEVGAGEIKLTVPEEVGIMVSYDLGVGSIQLDSTSIEGVGKNTSYKSSNYDTSEKKILITVSVGVGSLVIDRN